MNRHEGNRLTSNSFLISLNSGHGPSATCLCTGLFHLDLHQLLKQADTCKYVQMVMVFLLSFRQ